MTLAEEYARDVVEGRVITGEYLRMSCARFIKNLDRNDIYFDTELAERIIVFATTILCFWEGQWRGKQVIIYPWQAFIIQNIFSWKYKETNLRVIRSVYVEIARKNGKTTLSAIIAFIHAFLDNDLTPQILVGANNEEQAKICTNTFAEMCQISPATADLIRKKKMHVRRYGTKARSVSFSIGDKKGYLEAMSRDVKTKDGFNPSLGIIDEYHEATDDALLNVIASGQGARKEPLLVVITTAGFNKNGVCYQRNRKSAINVLTGKTKSDSDFSAIYEPDSSDDWKDEHTWIKSNPMIPYVDTLAPYLRVECQKAINEGATTEVNFKTKNLNTWVDSASVWIEDSIWIANHNPKLKKSDLEGLPCMGGLDLAQTRDLNAYTLFFPEVGVWGNEKHAVLLWVWLPEENIDYRGRNYLEWVKLGYVKTTPGNHSSPKIMLNDIKESKERYNIKRLHYDRYLAEWLAPEMANSGIEIYPVGMGGASLSNTIRLMEVDILGGKMEHFDNPIYRWSLSNVLPIYDANGNIRVSKSDPNNKIDPTMSKILAYDAWILFKAEKRIANSIMIL